MSNLRQRALEQKLMAEPAVKLTLDTLGFEEFQLGMLRQALAKPVGAIIVSGTCGSGVTTTLESLLVEKSKDIHHHNKCVRIVEHDEFDIDSSYTMVVPKGSTGGASSDSPFVKAVVQAMRLVPDIVHLGEVREEESAKALFEMTLTGHQVLTEVHAASALDIPVRLRCLGVSPDDLSDRHSLSALVYQTLLGVVCPHCALDLEGAKRTATQGYECEQMAGIEQVIDPSLHAGLRFRCEDGCEQCQFGVIGRALVAEVVIPDETVRECFRQSMDVEAWVNYRKQGGLVALEHGISKALRGIVDLREVEHRLDQIIRLAELDQMIGVDPGKQPFVIKADPLASHLAAISA